jgi:ABC-type multidrug transport system ATPase subunit
MGWLEIDHVSKTYVAVPIIYDDDDEEEADEGIAKRNRREDDLFQGDDDELPVEGQLIFALRDVSLSVQAGEGIALFGGRGSGKTTLLRIIAGLTLPSLRTRTVVRILYC